MAITETIVAPIWPQTADGKTIFNQKSDALAPQLIDIQNQMNTYATQANALRDEVNGFQQTATAQAVAAANSAIESAGYANDSLTSRNEAATIRDQTASIAASIDPGLITNGDDFSVDTNAYSSIREAWELDLLPLSVPLNLNFSKDLYREYTDIQNGYKEAPLRDIVSFSRASEAIAVGDSYKLETVSTDIPRVSKKGYLSESARESLMKHSSNWTSGSFENGWSIGSGHFRTLESGNHPQLADGENVTRYGPDLGESSFSNSSNQQVLPSLGGAGSYYLEMDLQAFDDGAGVDSVRLLSIPNDGGSGTIGGVIDLNSGVNIADNFSAGDTFSSQEFGAIPLGLGWFRCWIRFTTIRAVDSFRARAFPYDQATAITGDGVSGLRGTQAILVSGGNKSSKIETGPSTAVRLGDVMQKDIADVNLYSGAFFASTKEPESNSTIQMLFSVGDSSGEELRIEIFGTTVRLAYAINNAATSYVALKSRAAGNDIKCLLHYEYVDSEYVIKAYVNGVVLGSVNIAELPSNISRAGVGVRGFGDVFQWGETIKQFSYISLTPVDNENFDTIAKAITGI